MKKSLELNIRLNYEMENCQQNIGGGFLTYRSYSLKMWNFHYYGMLV